MSIAKLYRRDNQPFAIIPNEAIRNPDISQGGFRLLAYLMSHQDGYEITYTQIEAQTGLGRFAINQGIQNLVEHGWLAVERPKLPNGQYGAKSWTILNPNPATVDNSTMEFPHMEKPTDNKKNIPLEEQVKEDISIAQNEFEREFDSFWKLYPRKVSKGAARKAFKKAVKNEGIATILDGVTRLNGDPNKPAKQYLPYPATWLNDEGWLNEPYPERQMSRAEREAWELAQAQRNRQSRVEATNDVLREAEEARRRAEENRPEACEHRAVKLLCKICVPQ